MALGYSSEDVQQILERAMTYRQQQEFSRQQLEEMASELKISPDLLQLSEQEWLAEQEAIQNQQRLYTRKRREFKAHVLVYLVVNSFLILLNLLTCPKDFWAIYPITGWGIGLASHGWKVKQLKKSQELLGWGEGTEQSEQSGLIEGSPGSSQDCPGRPGEDERNQNPYDQVRQR